MLVCLAYTLMPAQHCKKLDEKVIKCIFFGYNVESRGNMLYHPQSKRILVSFDVVFVKETIHTLLACTKESNMTSQNVYDTLLPLFNGGSASNEA